jgi:ligand-binding SRPBCC domain-containing protein
VRIEQKITVDAPRHLVWEYVTEPANYPVFIDGRTRVTFRFQYGVAGGGIPALIAERVASISLNRRFRLSLINLKRAVEALAMEPAAG